MTKKHSEYSEPVAAVHAPVVTFPAWFFGPGGARQLVESATALKALGDGWHDSPAKVEDDEHKASEKHHKS